jgi:hypothetical protein
MKHRKYSLILAMLMTFAITVLATAQTPAPAGSDPSSAPTATQSDSSTHQEHSSAQGSEMNPEGTSDMPNTASPLALLALLGTGSIGAGFAAHRASKRFNKG